MKTITAPELKNILAEHKFWLESNGKQGTRADLTDADLHGANLMGADLLYANLKDAILTGTILEKDKAEKKAEKRSEVASVNAESSIRSEIEAIAKKHGFKIVSLGLELL